MHVLLRYIVFCIAMVPLFGEGDSPRVALFFSGRVFSYEDSLEWLTSFIKKTNADVFCSINAPLDSYHQQFLLDLSVKRSHFEQFQLPQKMFSFSKAYETNLRNACSMFYNHKKNMEMILDYQKEFGFQYDLVVYLRADILFDEELCLECDDVLHIPFGEDYRGINDRVAFGNVEIMEKYCAVYDHIEEYCVEYGQLFNPESILLFHLLKWGIPVKRFPFSVQLNQKRFFYVR